MLIQYFTDRTEKFDYGDKKYNLHCDVYTRIELFVSMYNYNRK